MGELGLHAWGDQLVSIEFLRDKPSSVSPAACSSSLLSRVKKQLLCYFNDPAYCFDLPLHLNGTPFQKKVWQALCRIPVGETLSYGKLAEKLKTSPRAIGNACKANPIPIIIPCHRVTAKNGLGGFSGNTCGAFIHVKTFLLTHEKAL